LDRVLAPAIRANELLGSRYAHPRMAERDAGFLIPPPSEPERSCPRSPARSGESSSDLRLRSRRPHASSSHRSDRGHWLDAAHVDLRKLLDERKDRVELRPQWLDLLVCDGDSGEMRDATHGRGVYGHGVFLPYGWPPRAASAL